MLGIDLGTSSLKLVAISRDGRVLAAAREEYKTISSSQGQAEQNCQDWLKALCHAAKEVRSRLPRNARVEAISLTGQMPTLVVLGKQKPVARAITWQDSRADRWVRESVDRNLRRDIYLKTGILIDGRYLAPMFKYHHGTKRKADRLLSAKDFFFHTLTGLATTDPSTASGYGLYNLRRKSWDQDLCKLWGIAAEQLPNIESSSHRAPLGKRGSQLVGLAPGTPVVLGCADSVAGAYAINSGHQRSNSAAVLTGSSTVIIKCDSQPLWDMQARYLVTPLAMDGMYGREADLLASSTAREWAANIFLDRGNNKQQGKWKLAYLAPPGADGLLFSPFLAGGEQGVLWNPNLKGTIAGLTLKHTPTQIVRALLEGMCFEIRRCLQVFDEGTSLLFVGLTGWMAEMPQQVQLLSDILGRPVRAFRLGSASALGTALLSGAVDRERYSAKTRPRAFKPSERAMRYNEIYANYVAQFPAGESGSRL